MSFENIKDIDLNNVHNRSCIMVVNFNNKELNSIKNISRLIGLKDIITLDYKNGNSVIRNILEDNIANSGDTNNKNKVILFNNVSTQKINALLDNLKKIKINRPLSAMITDQTIEWTIDNLIINLVNERKAISEGKVSNHK